MGNHRNDFAFSRIGKGVIMAKKDKDEMAAQEMPQTMEDYLLSQL